MRARLISTVALSLLAILCTAGCNPKVQPGFSVYVEQQTAAGVADGVSEADIQGSLVGSCGNGCTGNQTSFGPADAGAGNALSVPNGETPADWYGQFTPFCNGPQDGLTVGWDGVFPLMAGDSQQVGNCQEYDQPVDTVNSFRLANALPTTWTIASHGPAFSSTYGMPQLSLFSVANALISQVTATSIGSNGSSATFPFPKNPNGSALAAGLYGYTLGNKTASGINKGIGGNIFSIGATSTVAAPYGVDAANVQNKTTCQQVGEPQACNGYPIITNTLTPYVTLFNSGAIHPGGTVGTEPTAIKLYGTSITNNGPCEPQQAPYVCYLQWVTQPAHALVANTGSATVSIVDLVNGGATNIPVGTQPVALLLVGTIPTTAYVANLGSGTVSQISLSSHTVTGTVAVGSDPTSLALDPSGTAFWVGGLNYISKVNISNLAVVATYPVTGQVTSLSIAAGPNDYVYTVINGTTFSGQHAALSNGTPHTDYQMQVQGKYAQNSPAGPGGLPTWLQIGGPLVSSLYGNRYIVEGTPTGFTVLDLVTDTVMLQGTTAAPIVGIAVDPSQGTVYTTEPASNTFLTIPLPPVQTN